MQTSMTSKRKNQIRTLLKGIETGDASAVAVVNPDTHNKRMQTDVAYGHAADARRYASRHGIRKYKE